MNARILLLSLMLAFVLGATTYTAVHAAETPVTNPGNPTGGAEGALRNPLSINSLPELLTAILNVVIEIGTVVVTLMFVYIGFKFVTAQGNAEALTSARSALIWTVIGALILFGAKVIALAVENTVGAIS